MLWFHPGAPQSACLAQLACETSGLGDYLITYPPPVTPPTLSDPESIGKEARRCLALAQLLRPVDLLPLSLVKVRAPDRSGVAHLRTGPSTLSTRTDSEPRDGTSAYNQTSRTAVVTPGETLPGVGELERSGACRYVAAGLEMVPAARARDVHHSLRALGDRGPLFG